MKHKLIIFPFVAVLVIGVGVISAAGQTTHTQPSTQLTSAGPQKGSFERDPIRRLNLTPDQLEQIRVIREQNREERAAISQRVYETSRALEETLEADNPDEAALEQRVREASAAQAAAMRMRILIEVKIRRVLNQEQRTLLRSLRRQVDQVREVRGLQGPRDMQKRREVRSLRERRKDVAPPLPTNQKQSKPNP